VAGKHGAIRAAAFALLIAASVCAGCGGRPAATPTATPACAASPAHTDDPTAGQPVALLLSFGEPVWLGRGGIADACFTPDGSTLAVAWGQGLSLWVVEPAHELWYLPTPQAVLAVAIEPHNRAVAALLAEGNVLVANAAGQARQYNLPRSTAAWGDIAWAPDGHTIACQLGGPILLLDVESGVIREVPGSSLPGGARPYLAFRPDGAAITLAGPAGSCGQVLDARTGASLFALDNASACLPPSGTVWSFDGQLLATLGLQEGVRLYDGQTGQALRTMEGSGPPFPGAGIPGRGWLLTFSADGPRLLSQGRWGERNTAYPLVLWEATTGRQVAELPGPLPSEHARLAMALTGESVFSLYDDGELALWRITVDREETIARLPVLEVQPPLAWSADGRTVASPGCGGGLAAWDTRSGRAKLALDGPLTAPALSPDGRKLAVYADETRELRVYDLATGALERTLPGAGPGPRGAAFSPDGQRLAYGAANRILVADVATGKTVAELVGYPPGHTILSISWAPQGDALLTVSQSAGNILGPEDAIVLWEQNADGTFMEAYRVVGFRGGALVYPPALFSPSGRRVACEGLASHNAEVTLHIYDRTAHRVEAELPGYALGAWASDEVLLVAGLHEDNRLLHWNVRTGEKVRGEGCDTGANSYAPDGLHYAVVADGPPERLRALDVYDWQGRRLARLLPGCDSFCISWAPDGRAIAAIGEAGAIRLWPVASAAGQRRTEGRLQ